MNPFCHASDGAGHDRRQSPEPRRAEHGRWPGLEAALALVNRDLTATLPGQEGLILVVEPPWRPPSPGGLDGGQVYVAMPDGRWHGEPVNTCEPEEGDPADPDDEETALAVVAEAAQSTVMELLRQVWPICFEHGLGLHPRPAGTAEDWHRGDGDAAGPPVWWCRGRDGHCHDVSLVGELAGALPGERRRALRRGGRGRDGLR
ncbi:hypothetical protein [Streptomyces cellostaticus]|uniref:hypothetical protein n=1 Tax=Streptomyces cellostaticus TaxID=67285 RepID=UPI0020275A34|nr:hypothetical protein [Streptomyces cellostaticus]